MSLTKTITLDQFTNGQIADKDLRVKTFCLELLDGDGGRPQLEAVRVTQTLPFAEAIHRALIARAARGVAIDCPELVGQNWIGQPLSGNHGHAKILPVDLDQDQFIDHVIIHASMGFGKLAERAIRSMQLLHWGEKAISISLRMVAADRPGSSLVQALFPGMRAADKWTSLTPFVPPRFLKKSGKNNLEGQINAELASRELPPVLSVKVLHHASADMSSYVRKRQPGRLAPPQNLALAVELEIAEPIQGPLSIGYASHFGMGLFSTTTSV